jgi:hypothetical protein
MYRDQRKWKTPAWKQCMQEQWIEVSLYITYLYKSQYACSFKNFTSNPTYIFLRVFTHKELNTSKTICHSLLQNTCPTVHSTMSKSFTSSNEISYHYFKTKKLKLLMFFSVPCTLCKKNIYFSFRNPHSDSFHFSSWAMITQFNSVQYYILVRCFNSRMDNK